MSRMSHVLILLILAHVGVRSDASVCRCLKIKFIDSNSNLGDILIASSNHVHHTTLPFTRPLDGGGHTVSPQSRRVST